jgi:hypothetical protein
MKGVLLGVVLSFVLLSVSANAENYSVGAFYHPGWHRDSRMFTGELWGEGCNCSYERSPWYPAIHAQKFFPDQVQPLEPVLGYYDDTNVSVLEQEIEWASNYSIDFFVFNWYWYEGKQLYQEPVEDAFLKAKNKNKLDFAIHWVLGATILSDWITPNYTEEDLLNATDYIITHYFNQSNYLKINGKPVIMIMNPDLLSNQSDADRLATITQKMKQLSTSKGHNGLFLVASEPGENFIQNFRETGFDAFTHYHYGRFFGPENENILSGFKPWYGSYDDVIGVYEKYWHNFTEQGRGGAVTGAVVADIPYIIPLTPGTDTTPWNKEMGTVIMNNTPEKFELMLMKGKDFIDQNQSGLDKKTLIIEAWNEWSEGAVLEPEKHYGFGFLQAVKNVFYESVEGDLDGNGFVDVQDLIIITTNFGRTSNFDPKADIDQNGKIDIYDLVFVASRFT